LSITPRSPITPIAPPLSRNKQAGNKGLKVTFSTPAIKIIGVSLAVLITLIIFILWLSTLFEPQLEDAPNSTLATVEAISDQTDRTVNAPFTTLSLEQAKEAAQAELGRFVELQIKLEDEFNVQAWGQQDLQAAKDQALTGDNYFIQDEFEQAIGVYAKAANQLAELLKNAEEKFAQHIKASVELILALNAQEAEKELARARIIKPQDPWLTTLLKRAAQLPKIKALLLRARNLELKENYAQALTIYKKIEQLDSATLGLDARIAKAKIAEQNQTVKFLLGQGFKNLELGKFEAARAAFNRTLTIESANEIALAGLEQVSQSHDIAIILSNESTAKAHLKAEQWSQALSAYETILALDDTIQLAKNGKSIALSHAQAEKVLTRISQQPSKLSSASLFSQAQKLLNDARKLTYKGPRLSKLINSVSTTLAAYRDPVSVTFLSDNATEIILSNTGKLGVFQSKVLSLRPGEYTIRGSASGCRDIFLTVSVFPGIDPIEVKCMEAIR